MRDRLYLYLDTDQPIWATSAYSHCGEVDELSRAAVDREVIVMVPPTDVVLMVVDMPKISRAKLRQALPYALEEKVIADVDDLHFAFGDYQADGKLPVAIVSKLKMQQWLTQLQAWGVTADVLIPITLALPVIDNAWHILLLDKIAVIRSQEYNGFACDRENLADFLQLERSTNIHIPQKFILYHDAKESMAALLSVDLPVVEEVFSKESLLSELAKNVSVPALNLLQGEYAVKRSRLPVLQLGWKVVLYMTVTWVCLLFLYPGVSFILLKHKISVMQDEVAMIYRQQFPQATTIVAPRERMQEKWQHLSGQAGENKSLQWMAYIGKALSMAPNVKIKKFDFQQGQLTLELTAATSEGFSIFSDYLTQQGLLVEQQNANLIDGRISATIRIDQGGA